MKKNVFIAGSLAFGMLLAASLSAAEMTTLGARSGSKMRMEGTSSLHDWQVESPFIGGSLQVGKGFPLEPGEALTPGKAEVTGQAFIPVRSLKSLEKNGSPYSDKMDSVMNEEKLLAEKYPRITYTITEMVLKEVPKEKTGPYVYESKGDLAVAGVTNAVSMPVNVTPLGDGKIKINGTVTVKMSDYKISPPAPLGMVIKVGDEIKLIFDWSVAPQKKAAAK